jgi:hypothetical protein
MTGEPRMIQNNTIIKRMIDSHPTDRIGFNENIWPYTLKKWVKDEGYPIDEQGNPISPIEHFGFDMYEISGWFDVKGIRFEVEEKVKIIWDVSSTNLVELTYSYRRKS